MAEFALGDEQQLKQGFAEMAAQSQVIKKRNLELEQRNTKQQHKIQELTSKQNEVNEDFQGYKKQTKEEKEKSDAKQIELERTVKELEQRLEDMETGYEQKITKLNSEKAQILKDHSMKEDEIRTKEENADSFLQREAQMIREADDLKERLENEKSLRLEQVNQKELDRIKETE